LTEAVQAYTVLVEIIDTDREIGSVYYYVFLRDEFDMMIETVPSEEVYWMAGHLQISDREAVMLMVEYPGFWEDLKDILYALRINNYKKYNVFTKNDLMGEGDVTWEEYIGESEEDALRFYRDILQVEDIVSIIEMEDEA
jgi:hypothetical protein